VRLGLEPLPILRKLQPRLVTNGPSIIGPCRLAGLMAGKANLHRAFRAQTGRIDDIVQLWLVAMRFSGSVAAFAGNVQLDAALRVMIGTGAVTASTELEIGTRFPVLVIGMPPVVACLIGQPLLVLNAPLGRKDDFLAVDLADEALLPAVPNHPLDVFQCEVPH